MFTGKELVLVEEEYEPFDLNEEIMQIHFAKEKEKGLFSFKKNFICRLVKFISPMK